MLQILFLIIKIIGIILAVLLGLALLILLLVLFVPVRYQAYGIRSSRECRAGGRVSWLLRLLCIPFSFQDGELEIKIKLLGFTILDPLKGEEEAFRESVQRKTEQSAGKEEETKLICEQVYDLARMGQKPLTSEEMSKFIERSNLVLEMLAESGMSLIDWEADWAESTTALAVGMVVAAVIAVVAILVIKVRSNGSDTAKTA